MFSTSQIRRHPQAAGAFLLCLILTAMFAVSVQIRAPWRGMFGEPGLDLSVNAESTSAVTVFAVNEWLRERPPLHHLVVHVAPLAFDTPTPVSRIRELAYFPLTWMPLYIFGAITGQAISLAHTQWYSMACQFLTIIAIGMAIFITSTRLLGTLSSICLAAAAALALLFLQGPIYYFFYCFFPDIAVIPFLAATVLMESMRDLATSQAERRRFTHAVAALLFIGALVEWVMVVTAGAVLLKRLIMGELGAAPRAIIRNSLTTLMPTILAGVLFAAYITVNLGWGEVLLKFFLHTGLMEGNADESEFFSLFVRHSLGFVTGRAGAAPVVIIVLMGVVMLPLLKLMVHDKNRLHRLLPPAAAIFIASVACIVDALLLMDHHLETPHTALKFTLPFALGATLLPGVVLLLAWPALPRAIRRCVGPMAAAAIAGFVWWTTPSYAGIMDSGTWRMHDTAASLPPDLHRADIAFATFSRDMGDVYSGPAFYGKRIYPLSLIPDYLPAMAGAAGQGMPPHIVRLMQLFQQYRLMPEWLAEPPEKFTVGFLHWKWEHAPEVVYGASAYATEIVENDSMYLYILNEKDFCAYYDEYLAHVIEIPEDLRLP